MNIVSIGAGVMGRAFDGILEKKGLKIFLWDKDESKVVDQKPLSKIIPGAGVIFLCIPSGAIKEALGEIIPYLKPETIIISVSKGLEEESGKTVDRLLFELLPKNQPIALLSGPMFASELSENFSGCGILAAPDEVFEVLKQIFQNTNLHLEHSKDIHGVALASVLKNIYAVGLGMAETLELGCNFRGWFIVRAAKEMSGIIAILGGDPETAYGLAGLGDLITTGLSDQSRNFRVGRDFIKEGVIKNSEGIKSLPLVDGQLGKKSESFPLFSRLKNVIIDGEDPRESLGIII